MRLVMYNTLIGVTAGLALLLVPRAWAQLAGLRMPLQGTARHRFDPAGWAATLAVLGAVLTVLGGAMTLTHPLAAAAAHVDTLFGEPSLLLGVLLLATAWYLARHGDGLDADRARTALAPAGWVVAGLGLVLAFCAAAIVRFTAIGAAPAAEPVTGLLHNHPAVENTFFAILYGLSALGCLLFPAALAGHRGAWLLLYWTWTISGAAFTTFSGLNYYTHTGMLINMNGPFPAGSAELTGSQAEPVGVWRALGYRGSGGSS